MAVGGSTMNRVKVAVVGLGYWGPNLVRVLHELECAEITAVCDSNPAAMAKITSRFPAVEPVESFDRLLADMRSKGVKVAEPSDPFHDSDFIRALISTYTIAPTTDWATAA